MPQVQGGFYSRSNTEGLGVYFAAPKCMVLKLLAQVPISDNRETVDVCVFLSTNSSVFFYYVLG